MQALSETYLLKLKANGKELELRMVRTNKAAAAEEELQAKFRLVAPGRTPRGHPSD